MATRAYGQYCGFSRALEVVGERWALLVVRDLLVGPKRFSELQRGLAGIPTNVLTTRLKELEEAGVVRRAILPRPDRGFTYEMTEYGRELEPVVLELGRWGAKTLGDPRPGETITVDSIVTALRTTFQPKAARGIDVTYELRLGPIVVNARIAEGTLVVTEGAAQNPDLVMETGPGLRALMAREISPAEAIKSGSVQIRGNRRLLAQFVELFRI